MVNSRYRRFAATTFRSRRRPFTYKWHTLSLSYGVNLPSSLTRLLSNALVFSTCPPESVWGTVSSSSTQFAAFLGSVGSMTSGQRPRHHLSRYAVAFFSYDDSLQACTSNPAAGSPTLLRPCSAPSRRYRNVHLFPIDCAFRLRLRGRLTLPG